MIKNFWLIYVDDDANTFNIVGPLNDDTEITEKTVELQKQNRNVRIYTLEVGKDNKESLINQHQNQFKHLTYDKNLKW